MNEAKRALLGLSGGHFILDMYAAILIPLYPIIAQRLEINLATISIVIALSHGISSILQPLWGFVSDKLHKRFFMFWGLIFASVFMPMGYVAPNASILTLCIVVGMIGNAFYHPQVTSIIKNFYKDNTGLSSAIGIFLGLGTIGYSFGPYLSSYVVEKCGFNFIYISVIGVFAAIFILFFVPKIQKTEIKSASNFYLALRDILKSKACIFLILLTVLKACLVMSFGTYIPFLLAKYGFLTVQKGLIMTAFFIAGGLSMMFAPHLEKRIGLKGVILASYLPLLPLVIFSILSLKHNLKLLAIILFILIGFFILLAAGCILAHAQKLIPNNTGVISGIIQGFTLAVGSLLLIPLGNLAQHFGLSWALIIISFIAGLCAIYCTKTNLLEND